MGDWLWVLTMQTTDGVAIVTVWAHHDSARADDLCLPFHHTYKGEFCQHISQKQDYKPRQHKKFNIF